ncbi:hypothetical protein B0A52_00983 [Exophiala mesophila]|uniref:Uncharacterized protein n=1 Tax=Exophiala mesophila TaxID=212818 RepID=A0A438NIV1_EXOME|nr:hypothetical protein B0A52_00983 [Exophiala mesophila]
MSDPTEIRRGEFVYRDVLLVDLGQNRRHPRASAHDIKDLVMPKKSSAANGDQVAHWYEAQLVHYGLPRSRDKNTAKVRLMQAITTKPGGLKVPKELDQLEKDLKKEYSAAVKKAGVYPRSTGGKGSVAEGGSGSSKKRKAGVGDSLEETKSTTISVKVGDAVVEINQHIQSSKKAKVVVAGKKSATSTTKTTTTKANKDKSPKTTRTVTKKSDPKPKGTASPKPNSKTTKSTPTARTAQSGSKAGPSQARSTGPATKSTSSQQKKEEKLSKTQGQSEKKQPSQSYTHHSHSHDYHDHNSSYYSDNDSDEPPPYDSIDFTSRQSSVASDEASNRYEDDGDDPDSVQISGSYEISVQYIRTHCDLSLRIDHGSGRLWGRFGIGSKDGILRIDDLSGLAEGEVVSFGWRAADDQTGDLRFGRGCFGEVRFYGRGRVEGRFIGLLDGDDAVFEGSMVDERGPDAGELSWQWNQFPERAYGRA